METKIDTAEYDRLKAAEALLIERVKVNLIGNDIKRVEAAMMWQLKLAAFCNDFRVFVAV